MQNKGNKSRESIKATMVGCSAIFGLSAEEISTIPVQPVEWFALGDSTRKLVLYHPKYSGGATMVFHRHLSDIDDLHYVQSAGFRFIEISDFSGSFLGNRKDKHALFSGPESTMRVPGNISFDLLKPVAIYQLQ